jgi:hypothetical protein
MKQLFIIIMLVGFLTSTCGQSPKKVFAPLEMQTQNQFETDKGYCNNKAYEAAMDGDIRYHERTKIWRKVFEGCMEIKGYALESDMT